MTAGHAVAFVCIVIITWLLISGQAELHRLSRFDRLAQRRLP